MSDARTGVLELTLGDSYIGSAYSPQVEVTDTDTGHEVAITYMSPSGLVTERFEVADGEQGPQGPAGFSPTVTITDTPTGHTVTITDEDGPHSYDVPNYAQEEQERQDAWDALSGEVTDAITAAESATSAASTAAQSATSAATSATSAAQAATTAAASANTAASSANAAATAANAAASAASTAADAATTAAGDATDAASAANTAAEAAQEAATEVAPEVAWLWGNQLTGELSGDLLTTADTYAAPPMALTVDGRSTQTSTTGKNLLDPSTLSNGYITSSGGVTESTDTYKHTDYMPVTAGETYRVSQGGTTFSAIYTAFYDESKGFLSAKTQNNYTAPTYLAPEGAAYMRSSFNGAQAGYAMVEVNSGSWGGYEPYTGGKPSPSPDYPQPIVSVDSVELHASADGTTDATNWPVTLYDGTLRSLPDGTKDTLALTYLRPSTSEGWAWYSRELVQAVGHVAINGTEYWRSSSYTTSNMLVAYLSGLYFDNVFVDRPAYYSPTYMAQKVMCDRFSPYIPVAGTMQTTQGIAAYVTEADLGQCFVSMSAATVSDVDAFKTWAAANPFVIDYPIATPVTHDLGEVELSVLPAPNCTIWADPTTGVMLSYERNLTIAINAIEQAIADQ